MLFLCFICVLLFKIKIFYCFNIGIIVLLLEYDFDDVGKIQEVVICMVIVMDKGGYIVLIQLLIIVNEINDNVFVLDKGSYFYFVLQCMFVGFLIGQVIFIDKDVKFEYKDVIFDFILNVGFLVGNDGKIYVVQDLCDVFVGIKYDFMFIVFNVDGLKDIVLVIIVIIGIIQLVFF